MTFQAYIDTIQAKTGLTPADFKVLAEKKGFYKNGSIPETVKAMQIINWIKEEFKLGHGHAMAIVATLKGKKQ
jgi:hypothetical protein